MYLKKLELSGFKSFANPISLEFSPGITAIVGPNGSGKSNIADAVRWILGEQSMKNIRSQSGKDLIFSGSKKRSKLGKAKVSLFFDNQKGFIPLDYSEVVVSRNIFQDGTSEYFINKNPSKLMDVIELLAKANIGHKSFSVISQGMESEILKYSPFELHELLEEASGVRYLQLKKRRAERRLKTTQTNLEKIDSILIELTPHLRRLKREATKIEKKEKLKKKLVQLQNQFFFLRLTDLEKQKKEFDIKKENLEIKISNLKIEIFKLDAEVKKEEIIIKKSGNKFTENQKELENILDQRAKLNDQLANLRAQIQVREERQPIKEKKEERIDLTIAEEEFKYIRLALKKILESKNLNEVRKEIEQILNRVEKIFENSDSLIKVKPIEKENLEKLKNEQKILENSLSKISQKYEEQKAIIGNNQKQLSQERFFKLERKSRIKKDDLIEFQTQANEIKWKTEQVEDSSRKLSQDLEREKIDYNIIKSQKFLGESDQSIEQLESLIHRLKYEIEEIGGVDEITIQEYNETKERYNSLSKKSEDLKKAKKNLGSLIIQLTKEIGTEFDKNIRIINDNFNKYFRILFNGGKAHLKQILYKKQHITKENLGDEDINEEIEEETISKGIEIIATLPGKKIRNLRIFSGGEKALTSIALLLAIVSSTPPPFLVLDEVDATLDESNSQRFANLLSEFSENTQFIVITHNREFMNQADVLYGLTMGEDGGSKLLSLRLER